MRNRKVALWLVVLLAAMLALGGCQGASAEPTATATADIAGETTTPEQTSAPTHFPTPFPPIYFLQEFPPEAYPGDKPNHVKSILGLGYIGPAEISPHGRYIAVKFTTGLGLYAIDTLEPLWFRVDLDQPLDQISWSPDGSKLALVEHDKLLVIEIPTGDFLFERDYRCDHPDCYSGYGWQKVSWSPDSTRLAIELSDPTNADTLILSTADGSEIASQIPPDSVSRVYNLVWSTDGQRIAGLLAMKDGATHSAIWEIGRPEPLIEIDRQVGSWAPDLSLFTLQYESPKAVYTNTYEKLMVLEGDLAMSPDWSRALTLTNLITLWDTATQSQIWSVTSTHNKHTQIRWTPDQSGFVTYSALSLTLYDAQSGAEVYTTDQSVLSGSSNLDEAPESDIAWSHDGNVLATQFSDTAFKIWDAKNGELLFTYGRVDVFEAYARLSFIPENSRYSLITSSTGITLWDMSIQQPVKRIAAYTYDHFVWSKDSTKIGAYVDNDTVAVWDVASGQLTSVTNNPSDAEFDLEPPEFDNPISPDGSRKFVDYKDGDQYFVEIRDAQTDQLVVQHSPFYVEGPGPLTYVYWSPDGRFMAAVYDRDWFDIWDTQTGILILDELIRNNRVRFSPDSRMVAWIENGVIFVWSLQ